MVYSRRRSVQTALLAVLLQSQCHGWLSGPPNGLGPQRHTRHSSLLTTTTTTTRGRGRRATSRTAAATPSSSSVSTTDTSFASFLPGKSPQTNSIWTSDNQVIDSVLKDTLKDRRIQPPWNRPDCSTRTFNWLLSQLAVPDPYERQRPQAAIRAIQILHYLQDASQTRPELQPDTITLNAVLAAVKTHSQTPAKAHAILTTWQRLASTSNSKWPAADLISFNTVAAVYAQQGNVKGALVILEALTVEANLLPDSVTYSTVLRAHAVAGQADQAQVLLKKWMYPAANNNNKGGAAQEVTTDCSNQVLSAVAKKDGPAAACTWLATWDQKKLDDTNSANNGPNVQSYNIVLSAWSRSSSAAALSQALELLEHMPDRDSVSYTTVIGLCCRGRGQRASKAGANNNSVLDQVDVLIRKAWDDPDVTFDSAFVSNVLFSISCCEERGMAAFAQALMEEYLDSTRNEPNVNLYNALLYCWAKSGDRGTFRRVLDILSEMQQVHKLRPSVKTYTTVLDALGKTRNPEAVQAAQDVVSTMLQQGPKPNVQVYTALIQTYARSRLPSKAVRASDIVLSMKDAGCMPNIVTYNALLNACEHTDVSDRICTENALKVAFLTLDGIRSSDQVSPNHVTYGTFLGVLANLMPAPTRQEIVSLVFRRCLSSGHVSRLVLKKLRQAVDSKETLNELLQGHAEDQLPAEWTARVREARARDLK